MKVSIPKLGETKKTPKNYSRINSTTTGFGFCQPIDFFELEPDTTINYRLGQSVRLGLMPCPTFGSIKYKSYMRYIKMEDIYHPFPSLLAGQSYFGSESAYIPTQVPDVYPAFLNFFLRLFGVVSVWKLTNDSTSNYRFAAQANGDHQCDLATSNTVMVAAAGRWDVLCGLNSGANVNFFASNFLDGNKLRVSSWESSTVANPHTVSPNNCDWMEYITVSGTGYLICGRFGTFSRNLSNVLVGLGYQLNESVVPVSVLPLVAYYKAWFDLFMPDRDKTWRDTNAHGFIERIEQYNRPNFNTGSGPARWCRDANIFGRFVAMLDDIGFCYYTDNVDFVSAHVDGNGNGIGHVSKGNVSYIDSSNLPDTILAPLSPASTAQASAHIEATSLAIGQTALDVLKIVARRLNIGSVIGGRLGPWFKSMFGSDYVGDQSTLIGTQILDLQIDDVYSTAETQQGALGQYAGKSVGGTKGQTFKFSNNLKDHTGFGYVIVLSAAVPASGNYSQAQDMLLNHLKPNDFYHHDVDSQTLVPTARKNVFAVQENSLFSSYDLDSGFGNLPVHFEYKTRLNVINGEQRLQSTRDQYLPYNLDRLLPYSRIMQEDLPVAGVAWEVSVDSLSPSVLVNSSKWRYVGRYPWIGMFDRIFANADTTPSSVNPFFINTNSVAGDYIWRLDDNFIVENYIDCTKINNGLPVSDSWKTDCELRDNTIDITPA